MKKTISRRAFEKRLKYISNPEDRDFFASCFEAAGEKMALREDLSAEDKRTFKTIRKVIAVNRKLGLKLGALIVFGIFAASVTFFFAFIMNPLLERALERGLETLFEARADVDNFHLNLFHFRVGIDGITVANRHDPMKNLFQTGRMEFRLKPEAVLRGKIYIEEIRTDAMRFGTARTVSGALPGLAARNKNSGGQAETPPLVDLKNFDAMGLLNREFDKLATPKLYDTAVAEYNAALEKWKGQVDHVKSRKDELVEQSRPLMNLNTRSLQSVEAVTGAVRDIVAMVNSVQAAVGDVENIVKGIDEDIKKAVSLEQQARGAITGDFNHLKSYLDFGSGEAFAALEPSIREILSAKGEQYLDYGLLALHALEKLKASQDAKPKQEKPNKAPAFKGRDVAFPSREYPKFFLGIFATDFTIQNWRTALDIRDISSNPDLSGVPVTLSLSVTEIGAALERAVDFKGSADLRTAAVERFTADVKGRGFPVSLERELAHVGIGGFKGDVGFALGFSGRTGGGVTGSGSVGISKAQLINPSGTLAEAVDAAVRDTKELVLGIRYVYEPAGKDEFGITTNIGDLVKAALDRIIRAYAAKAMDELERVLREKINQYIDGRFVSKEELDLVFKAIRGDKAALDGLKNSLDSKKNEFEQFVKNAASQVKDEVKQQTEQAIQDALQGKTPVFQPPSIPNLPKLPF
jgi:uncharacterized protein (TIGR03545 family)